MKVYDLIVLEKFLEILKKLELDDVALDKVRELKKIIQEDEFKRQMYEEWQNEMLKDLETFTRGKHDR